jgi:hypothetical protein
MHGTKVNIKKIKKVFPVFLMDCLILYDGTDRLTLNVVTVLPFSAAQNPRVTQISVKVKQSHYRP